MDVGARFKILVLHDIGGSLCFRNKNQPKKDNGETNPNFYFRKNVYIYVRPGALDYIRSVQSHPRVIFGFYSSMKASNITEVVQIMSKQEGVIPFVNFDAEYCSLIEDNPRLKPL